MYIAVDESYSPTVFMSPMGILNHIIRYNYIVKDRFDDVVKRGDVIKSIKQNGCIYLHEDLDGEFVEKVTFVEDV